MNELFRAIPATDLCLDALIVADQNLEAAPRALLRELVTQFVNTGLTHHVYRYSDKQLVIEEPSAGSEILFHPSGRSATATTIHLHGQAGSSQKLTVSITGRVSIL